MSVAIPLSTLNADQLLETWRSDLRAARPRTYVGLYSACIARAARDDEYAQILQTTTNYPDGMGVVWSLRRRLPPDRRDLVERVATTDFARRLMRACAQMGLAVNLYGSTAESNAATVRQFLRWEPKLRIGVASHGFTELAIDELRPYLPGVVLVGLGVPTQELWATRLQSRARETGTPLWIYTVGGLFDHIAGVHKRAPEWLQRVGLEWLFRTAHEPRRLAKRYVPANTWFAINYLLTRRDPLPLKL